MEISPQFEVKQLVEQILEGGVSPALLKDSPKPFWPQLLWAVWTRSTKSGLAGLTTGIKTAPLCACVLRGDSADGEFKSRSAHFPADLLPRGYRLQSGCLPFEPWLLSGPHIIACFYFIDGCWRECF